MEEIPLAVQFGALVVLLACSAFFSMAETAMMASNRHRLRHLAGQGDRGAKLALELLGRTDKMLGVILLGNNLINAAAATLVSLITIELFGEGKLALSAGTLLVTFAILVFSEITPKILGAAHADRLARVLAFLLWPLLRAAYPVVWFVNLFVDALLRLLRLKPKAGDENSRLSVEELRSLVLESGNFIPQQHQAILLNLFDLEHFTVADIMMPRGEIEAIDLAEPIEVIREQLATSYHSRVMVYDGDPGNIVGVLQRRRLLAKAFEEDVTHEDIREQLVEPYFLPEATPIYSQLQFFRDNRQKFGLVVDEYGEIEGLVTLEDIIEEIIGKFTTGVPDSSRSLGWSGVGDALIDGMAMLRDINRQLAIELPLDGPRTLNGLILEHLQDIPESGVSLRIAGVPMEIVQTQDRKIKTVRLQRPDAL
jgi:Mg2+/Co2+ transporter CorB